MDVEILCGTIISGRRVRSETSSGRRVSVELRHSDQQDAGGVVRTNHEAPLLDISPGSPSPLPGDGCGESEEEQGRQTVGEDDRDLLPSVQERSLQEDQEQHHPGQQEHLK